MQNDDEQSQSCEEETSTSARTRRSLSRRDKETKNDDVRMENDDGEVTVIDFGREDVFVGKDPWDWSDDGEFGILKSLCFPSCSWSNNYFSFI